MFKFNFSNENVNDNSEIGGDNNDNNNEKEKQEQEQGIDEGEYGVFDINDLDVKYDSKGTNGNGNGSIESLLNNDDNYKRVHINDGYYVETIQIAKLNEFINENLIEFNKTHDLVSGKYEGGLKIWECSLDLSKYLLFNYEFNNKTSTATTTTIKILELGCGHALPILTLIKYKLNECNNGNNKINYEIYLQDFNRNCLETITYFNIKRNILKSGFNLNDRLKIKFVYGDWKLLFDNKQLPNNYFDLILTSETIYNCLYYKSLLNLMIYTLKHNHDVNNAHDDDDGDDRRNDVNSCNAAKKLKSNNDDDDDDDGKQTSIINKSNNGENNSCSSFILLAAKTYYFGCGGNIHEFVKLAKSNEYKLQSSNNLLLFNTCSSSSSSSSTTSTLSVNKQDQEEKEENEEKHDDLDTTSTSSNNITPSPSSSLIDSVKEQQEKQQEQKEKQENSISISREIIKLYY